LGLKTFTTNVIDSFRTRFSSNEKRSGYPYSFLDGLFQQLQNIGYDADVVVNSTTAMRISTAFTCVLVRGESLASLPASVKQSTSSGSRTATNHSAHHLIHDKPNPFQNASEFWQTVSAHIDLEGEAIAIISFSGRWMPSRIDLIPNPKDVDVVVVDGRPWYKYKGVVYEDWKVLHFKDLSLDGIRGCSKIQYNAETLGYAAKLKAYGKKAIGNKPPGYFSTDAPYDTVQKQQDNIAKAWKEKIAAGDAPTVPFGLKYNSLMINPGDAQYLDAVNATKEDIYGIFRVPPTLAQNYERATFANAEQQDLVFTKYTMLPLITKIEQECNAKLFAESNRQSAEPYYVKFNVAAFMRGDFKSRTEGYRTLFNCGLVDGDTVAELEDWNKWEGGNLRLVPMNMIPLSKAEQYAEKLIESLEAPPPSGNDDAPDKEGQKRFDALKGFIYNYSQNELKK
jgi:HK97 family phage portal protein